MSKEYPIICESEYYLSIETELFYFDIYRAWKSSTDRTQDMFRAGINLKKGERKYYINCALFAEWDYQSKSKAFEAAKLWLYEYIVEIGTQLLGANKSISEVIQND